MMMYTKTMKKLEKKIWPEGFEAILNGSKSYELRLGDFDIQEGDVLVLREWEPETEKYTGRSIECAAGYVSHWKLSDLPWAQEEIQKHGLCTISLQNKSE